METHTWKAIRNKGLLNHINSPSIYLEETKKGLLKASDEILDRASIIPTIQMMKKVHKSIFENVTPWAGEPTKTQLITGGYVTCEPQKIEDEYKLLSKQITKGLESNDINTKMYWVAFAAARLLRIHAFKDGNKRAIGVWIGFAIQQDFLLGFDIGSKNKDLFCRLAASKIADNLEKNIKSLREGNLKPFGEELIKLHGKEPPPNMDWKLPFAISPKFSEEEIKI